MTLLQDTMISMQPLISALSKLSSLELFLAITVAHMVLKFFQVVYRISPLHPLAKVPGPRLAAASWWYRTYYEVWPHYGGMVEILEKLHVQYGPVVRIGPSEVHFSSPSAYLQIYSNASKVTKDPKHYHCYNEDETSFGFCNPAEAKERREIMQPFFSRRNLRAMHYVLEDKLCLFTQRLRSVYEENPSGHVINMAFATKSFTGDIITEFCFARTLDSLRTKPDFSHPLIMSTEKALAMFAVFKHFPLVKHIVNNIPDKVLQILMPQSSEGVRRLKDMVGKQLDEFLRDPERVAEEVEHEVIYHRLLGVGKYEEKKEDGEFMQRSKIGRRSLHDEAQALVFAGMDTVGNALTIGTYYILSTPGVVDKLLDELKTVWPTDPWMGMPAAGEEYKDGCGKLPATAQWEKLEKLPYLGGVIRESLRLSHGVTSPLQRLVSAQGLIVDGWTLPAGTGVSSGNTFIHLNPTIFPDPHTFRPERWIGEDSVGLEKYLVAFCKGPRQCLGINLAWCELYLTFATLYRRFEFEFAGTPPESLKFRDFFTPVWSPRTNVRVKPRLD